tara:strand:- start:66 stop:641 length:576 start_codon:yes stop_codon:yes gene_type:complete
MENFISIYERALSSDDCKLIIDDINSSDLEPGVIMGNVVNKEKKDSLDVPRNFIDYSPTSTIIRSALYPCKEDYIKKHPQLNKIHEWDVDTQYNLQKYNPNQGYHVSHCENAGGTSTLRVLAWMIYLNTVNDEGGTSFDNYNIQTLAVEGSLLIWPAHWTHFHHGIVSPTETKYIVTGWCSYSDFVSDIVK